MLNLFIPYLRNRITYPKIKVKKKIRKELVRIFDKFKKKGYNASQIVYFAKSWLKCK